ncbi:DUF2807 domain-containing protein [uncultured Lacinutrix sp.]|uniref:GIN domain-containing protein n=1 Tax=uncultured Lacinutrix sp. TaxID=574032 RepID=UPI002612CBF9|nr:DUF2807 domain-containing protein [uncultured Lacinutrix sp.]
MNKKLHLALFAILITFSSFSQDKEKIKGSRNVITELTEVAKFNRLVVGEDFEIKLLQGFTPSVQIEADDNLFKSVAFDVQEGSLKFNKLQRVTSHKKFEITVVFVDSLNTVELKDNSEITSANALNLEDFTLITNKSTEAYLTLKSTNFKLIQNEKSKAELNVTAENVSIELNDGTNLKALINASEININMPKKAHAKIEGDTNSLNITTDNNAVLKAEKLTAKDSNLITNGKADVYIEVTKELTIEASGSTETYIYGSPKIGLNKFEGEAIIRKK